MADGFYVWTGQGWAPSDTRILGTLIAPSATPPKQTTTSLTASPTSIVKGSSTTLTATVSPTAAGTVAFQYYTGGAWSTFSTKTVSGTTASTATAPTSSVTYRAVFSPTTPTAFRSSTSGTRAVSVTAAPVKATTPIVIGNSTNSVGVYKGSGARRSDVGSDDSYYGYYSSFNGDNRSLIVLAGVNYIRAVAKADIKSATISFTNRHTYPSVGSSVRIVPLNNTSLPSTFVTKPGGGFVVKVPDGGSASASIPLSIAQLFGAGGAANSLAIIAAVGGTSGYGYLSADSVRITFNR